MKGLGTDVQFEGNDTAVNTDIYEEDIMDDDHPQFA